MDQYVIYLGEYTVCTLKECVSCSVCVSVIEMSIRSSWLVVLFRSVSY